MLRRLRSRRGEMGASLGSRSLAPLCVLDQCRFFARLFARFPFAAPFAIPTCVGLAFGRCLTPFASRPPLYRLSGCLWTRRPNQRNLFDSRASERTASVEHRAILSQRRRPAHRSGASESPHWCGLFAFRDCNSGPVSWSSRCILLPTFPIPIFLVQGLESFRYE